MFQKQKQINRQVSPDIIQNDILLQALLRNPSLLNSFKRETSKQAILSNQHGSNDIQVPKHAQMKGLIKRNMVLRISGSHTENESTDYPQALFLFINAPIKIAWEFLISQIYEIVYQDPIGMNLTDLQENNESPQQTLFNFDIGVVDGLSKLNCSINLHEKSFRYYKCRKEILQCFDLNYKLKKWAFKRLYSASFSNKQNTQMIFIPEQLYKGNRSAIPAFLKHLKKHKVQSFINLNITNKKYMHQKYSKLFNSLRKVVNNIKYYCFKKLGYFSCSRLKKKIEALNKVRYTSKNREKCEWFSQTTEKRNHRSLNISYTRIHLDPQNHLVSSKSKAHSLQKIKNKTGSDISLKKIEAKTAKKMYRFQSIDCTWDRKTPERTLYSFIL